MPTRLNSVVFDAADPSALARFWATATGWPITYEQPDEVVVEPPEDDTGTPTEPGLPLVFGLVDDPKVSKNRVHIDLNTRSVDEQREIVRGLDDEAKRVSRMIARIEQQVALLIEHREALITAAVTGRLDVAKAAA